MEDLETEIGNGYQRYTKLPLYIYYLAGRRRERRLRARAPYQQLDRFIL